MGDNVEAVMALAPKGKEVSLKTLKKKEIDKIMKAVADGKQAADDYYRETIEPKILEREEIYNATKDHYRHKFPRLSESSEWVSRDVKTSIDWIIPQLMEVFTGPDKPVSVQARSIDKVDAARKVEQLMEYQLDTKNDYTSFCNDIWNDALKLNYGVAKVWWRHEEDRTPMQVMIGPDDYEVMNQLAESAMMGQVEITKVKQVDGGYFNVEYDQINVTENYPVIERLPPSEFRFSPDGTDINLCKFVAHRKIVKGDYLKRRENEGEYSNVDKAIENAGDTRFTAYDETHNRGLTSRRNRLDDGDNASKDVELYECYVSVDYNNDGIYEKLIVHTVGDSDVPIKIQTNDFGRVPFFVLCSERDPCTIFNENSGFADIIEQQQDLKTAVIRQMIVNIAKCNNPQMAFDQANVDVEALLDNEDLVPTNGMPGNLLYPIATPPMSGATMSLVEYSQNEIEAQTGSTRYNQGLDSNSLNKMLDIHTPVPMHDGSYKELGNIHDGDVVIGKNGKPTTVLKAHVIHMPERAYLMKFASGEEIKAGGEHLWTVTWAKGHPRRNAERHTVNTDELFKQMNGGRRIWIDRVERPDFDGAKELPLDPYMFGLWLGDGCLHTSRITTEDDEVRDYVAKWAESKGGFIQEASSQNSGKAKTYDIKKTGLRAILHSMDCVRDSRYEDMKDCVKHIPEIYFRASYADRLALLQGLMDTDGCHHSGALCIFSQKEGQLLDDVVRLIESLGGFPTKHDVDPGKLRRDGVHYYNIHFNLLDCPFRLARKKKDWKKPAHGYMRQEILSITPIEPIPMRCLTVSAEDGQFCVGRRFTVTHNTATGITAVMGQAEKRQKNLARLASENFFKPIFRFLIELNQNYGDDEQMIRVGDQNVSISKEDMDVDYDLILNIGHGAGTKEARIQYIMVLLQQIYPIVAQQGIINANSWFVATKSLLEEMGLMGAEKSLVDPASDEYKQAQQAQQQQQLALMQAQQQADIAGKKAIVDAKAAADIRKSGIPKVSATLNDLPPDAIAQILQKMGLPASPRGMALRESHG